MKLNDILVEATADDSDFARNAFGGKLANKSIAPDVKFGKFLGRNEEFAEYRGSYDLDSVTVQIDSWVKHPETRQDPAEYDGIDDDVGGGYDGKFEYGYDSEDQNPHYWRFTGNLELDYGSKTAGNMEFEGVGTTWQEAIKDLMSSMDSYAENNAQDIYNGY